VGKGNCPVCGKFQPNNDAAVTHGLRRGRFTPVETTLRDELMEQLFTERGGRDAVDIIARYLVQEYAELTVHINRVDTYLGELGTLTKAGRQPAALKVRLDLGARRDQVAAKIRNDAPSGLGTSPNAPGLDSMPTPALELAQELLSRLSRGEVLTEREQGQLDVLRGAMYGRVLLPPEDGYRVPEPGDADYREAAEPTSEARPPAAVEAPQPAVPEDIRRILEYSSEAEVERRRAEATAVMLKQLGKTSPFL